MAKKKNAADPSGKDTSEAVNALAAALRDSVTYLERGENFLKGRLKNDLFFEVIIKKSL